MTKPLLPRRLRKAVKYGPWGYRFWREAARLPYNALLKTPAVVEIEPYFPAHAELLARYETVRAEVLTHSLGKAVPANHEIMRHQKTFYDHDKIAWGMIPLRAYGLDYPKNMERFPTLGRFLKAHREVKSATISVFPPGKHLRPHKGPFKGVWRYHLGLYVKEFEDGTTAGELVVDGKKYYLREGEALLWDDTFMHEARNTSDEPRIVLLLDVMRNDQPLVLRGLSHAAMASAQIAQIATGMRKRGELQ